MSFLLVVANIDAANALDGFILLETILKRLCWSLFFLQNINQETGIAELKIISTQHHASQASGLCGASAVVLQVGQVLQ